MSTNSTYADFYRQSIDQRDSFWSEQAKLIDWQTPPQQVCDYSNPPFAKWFVGGTTNLCHNAVDRHLATRASQAGADAVVAARVGLVVGHHLRVVREVVGVQAIAHAQVGRNAGQRGHQQLLHRAQARIQRGR